MKRFSLILSSLLLIFMINPFQETQACIDPDSTVVIIIKYDSTEGTPCDYVSSVEMRLTDLGLMNETPNKVCACGFGYLGWPGWDINYIAFVDSGTNDPYQGFSNWNNTPAAIQAWKDAIGQNWGWIPFNSIVTGTGLQVNDPVDLIIRMEFTPSDGVTIPADSSCIDTMMQDSSLDNRLANTGLATDEWDPQGDSVKKAHTGFKSFYKWSGYTAMTYQQVTESHFTAMDTAILNNIPDTPGTQSVFVFNPVKFEVIPNPASSYLNVSLDLKGNRDIDIKLFDVMGKEYALTSGKLPHGNSNLNLSITDLELSDGIYFMAVQSGDDVVTKKIMISK